MKKIPATVKDHIANAHYYLEAAQKFPSPTKDAAQILLLLTSWENIVIADKELSAWAKQIDIDAKVYKDHSYKFKDAPEIHRVIIGAKGSEPRQVRFSTGRDFVELRQACQYGSNTESKDVSRVFQRGWHTDTFQRALIHKIEWVETILKAYEELLEGI